jgi:hypothetical protein
MLRGAVVLSLTESKKSRAACRSGPSGKMYLKVKAVSVHLGDAESTMRRCATRPGCRAA